MPARTLTHIKALISRDISRLGLGQTNPLHPDPSRPIIDTRAGNLPMGLGGIAAPAAPTIRQHGRGMVAAKVGAFPLQYQRLNPICYRATTKTRPSYVCVRTRAHVHGNVYIYSSMVADRYKVLFRKGKSLLPCLLPCPYHAAAIVAGLSKSLKTLETNKILGVFGG